MAEEYQKALEQELEALKKEVKEKEQMISILSNYVSIMDLKLNIFQAVGKITTTTFSLEGFLDSIMDMILKTMKVDAGSILFLNEETGLLEFKVAKGSKSEEVKKFKFALGEGIVGWVASSGQSEIVPEVIKDEHFKKDVSDKIKYPVSNIMCVPMKVNEKVIGVI